LIRAVERSGEGGREDRMERSRRGRSQCPFVTRTLARGGRAVQQRLEEDSGAPDDWSVRGKRGTVSLTEDASREYMGKKLKWGKKNKKKEM